MSLKELKQVNILTATFSFLLNVFYFLPISITILRNGGGPFGFGLIILCITVPLNLLIIPAICFFLPKWKNSESVLYVNFFALIGLIICFGFFKSMAGF
jgi:hypothetical protein